MCGMMKLEGIWVLFYLLLLGGLGFLVFILSVQLRGLLYTFDRSCCIVESIWVYDILSHTDAPFELC